MTYNEYKQQLENCGPLDDVAKGLLSAFELGYAQGLKEGGDMIGRTPKDEIISMASKAYITPTGAFTPMTNEALVRFADLVCASVQPAMVDVGLNEVMEQAEKFAKAWALIGSSADWDNAEPVANTEKKKLRRMIASMAANQKLVQPDVCCGDYANCMKPCTPRGKWLACKESPQQNMEEYLRKAYKLTEELHKHLSVSPKK